LTLRNRYAKPKRRIFSIVQVLFALGGPSRTPGWRVDVDEDGNEFNIRPEPSRKLSTIILAAFVLAELFMIVAILWQHVAVVAQSATTEVAFNGAVRGDVGTVAMGLGWGAIGANLVTTLGSVLITVGLRLSSELIDEEDRFNA
jgi:hypothetical protein